jgi:hypothetical protein
MNCQLDCTQGRRWPLRRRITVRLMISVRDEVEAAAAVAGGADIIDI